MIYTAVSGTQTWVARVPLHCTESRLLFRLLYGMQLTVCVTVRPSGTEDIVRVYAEADTRVMLHVLFITISLSVCNRQWVTLTFADWKRLSFSIIGNKPLSAN